MTLVNIAIFLQILKLLDSRKALQYQEKTEEPLRFLGFFNWWRRGELNPCLKSLKSL
nr:MAG TPA: hypothetical protein [Caudoviricetes sp.]